jgi:hypothetical protein
MPKEQRSYTALIRPSGGMKETLPPYSKIHRKGEDYIFLGIIQDGLDRGKIRVARLFDSNTSKVTAGIPFNAYPSEFGCEVVY